MKTHRKFRIRFLPTEQQDAAAVAQACQTHLSSYFTFLDLLPNQHVAAGNDGQECIDLKQLAQAIQNPQYCKWPKRNTAPT